MSVEQDEAIAAEWLAREDRGLTAEEQGALQAWLAASSLNRVSYLRLKAVWQRADRLAALKSPLPSRPPARIWSRPVAAAIAASLLVLAGAGWFVLQQRLPAGQDYATGIGERQAVRLADGTQPELNTTTRLHAEGTRKRRLVPRETREAYIDVVHDAERPFSADEKVTQVVPGVVLAQARQAIDHAAVCQHDLEDEHEITHDAITYRRQAAGIGRQVTADLATAFRSQ